MIISVKRDNTSYVPPQPASGGEAILDCSPINSSALTPTTYTRSNTVYVSPNPTMTSCTVVSATKWNDSVTYWEPVNVSGHAGVASNPNVPNMGTVSIVEWWAEGVHYSIMGTSTVNVLVDTAQSMDT